MKLVIKGKSLASLRLGEKPLADWKFEVAYIRQKQTLATEATSDFGHKPTQIQKAAKIVAS